jgi:hypothetical protein
LACIEGALELGLGAEKTGIEKFHYRPKVADVVFDRRACQWNAIIAFERARGVEKKRNCSPRLS